MWFVLQIGIVVFVVWLVDDAKLGAGAVVWGAALAFLTTWILSGALHWLRSGPRQTRQPPSNSESPRGIERAGGHLGDRPQLSPRRRIGQNIRKLI